MGMNVASLRFQAAVRQGIRDFFATRDYLEVDTPLLAPDLIPESCLEVFETRLLPPRGSRRKGGDYWLIPSPELWMKKLIAGLPRGGGPHAVPGGLTTRRVCPAPEAPGTSAARRGGESVEGRPAQNPAGLYQICHCFRNGESLGRIHSPEFSMLEYYTLGADYRDSIGITEELCARFLSLAADPGGGPACLSPPFQRISVEEAFARWAGFDLYRAAALPGGLEEEARRLGLDPAPGLDRGTLYDLIFVDKVEPAFPRDCPVVLMDYPAFVPCLAKKSPGGATVERWELYSRGIELANCYTEETDPRAVRDFFETETAAKEAAALVPHRVDNGYWKTFLPRRGPGGRDLPFPPCSGAALGLDRLLMVLTGASAIDDVLPFPVWRDDEGGPERPPAP